MLLEKLAHFQSELTVLVKRSPGIAVMFTKRYLFENGITMLTSEVWIWLLQNLRG